MCGAPDCSTCHGPGDDGEGCEECGDEECSCADRLEAMREDAEDARREDARDGYYDDDLPF
jgi:hypothetical protein